MQWTIRPLSVSLLLAVVAGACTDPEPEWECVAESDADPDSLDQIGCERDFELLASAPLDASIPGATSAKTIYDLEDPNGPRLYFQNSKKYAFHWSFAYEHLSGNGLPFVPELSMFNLTEYTSAERRFVLGALTYYEGPDVWCWEIAPYDTASAEMVTEAYDKIVANSYVGSRLYFHPTSQVSETIVPDLPERVKVITTDELFAGIDYQPLNLGESYGKLRVMKASELESNYVSFRDIVVLDDVPNDISVVLGIITAQFQTPLSHVNVLSQNRGTPNMGLREADQNPDILALDGKWVRLDVGAFDYELAEVTKDEADAWWDENRPEPLGMPDLDLSVTDFRNTIDMIDVDLELKPQINDLIPAFGGKASHYGGLSQIETIRSPVAFAIPVFYFAQFMETNGFYTRVEDMLADPDFQDDAATRDAMLGVLRDDMKVAPVDAEFEQMLLDKLEADYPGLRMRFRSSTNAEDLEGFTGAGLYTSKSGDPNDPLDPVLDAVRTVWASVWYFRAYEEREYRGIDHMNVAMALLVHPSFTDEEANGVALTGNPYDVGGAEPGFYVNVQEGEASVVQPDPETTTDQYIHYFYQQGRPAVFLGHSSLVPEGENVLTNAEINELGEALDQIHVFFHEAYGPPPGENTWYAMDVEFKFDGEPGEDPVLHVKQARPHPGWGE